MWSALLGLLRADHLGAEDELSGVDTERSEATRGRREPWSSKMNWERTTSPGTSVAVMTAWKITQVSSTLDCH